MFTKTLMVVGLTWIMSFSPAAYAGTAETEACKSMAAIVEGSANARDKGVSPKATESYLIHRFGAPENIARMVIIYVYGNPSTSGEELADIFYTQCATEGA